MQDIKDPKGIYIGTSGWSYPEWNNVVYPKTIPKSQMFEYYSRFFYTSEINSTFYQIPSIKVAKAWAKKAPKFFKYSAKVPNLVTHKAKLNLEEYIKPLSIFIQNMK
ncbi:MAG: DUF72 domain-containing protein, partial [Candidatus Lokiarchaeota archaeon]|nr:DUF72 domain-containing protein [Candidatus Lokiarchaeota archaeon]